MMSVWVHSSGAVIPRSESVMTRTMMCVLAFATAAAFSATALGQDRGSIVGWGGQVIAPPSGLTHFATVHVGENHSLAVNADGSIVAWGDNLLGQCIVPTPNTGFVAAAPGMRHSLGLRS